MEWGRTSLFIGLLALLVSFQITGPGYNAYRFAYLHGPCVMGGWEGQPTDEVCSRLTQTSSQLWRKGASNERECIDIIDRRVTSHIIGSLIVVIIFTVYHTFQCMSYLFFWSMFSGMGRNDPAIRSLGGVSPF